MLERLIPTHNSLRNPSVLPELVAAYKSGKMPPLSIPISKMEDGQMYIHDHHHRVVAFIISGGVLDESMLDITPFTYFEYLSVNINVGYVTPFDPRSHCRQSNFLSSKLEILEKIKRFYPKLTNPRKTNEILRIQIMNEFFDQYAEPRSVFTLRELVDKYA